LPDLERVSVSGDGSLAALGSREKIQVIDVPGGNEVMMVTGRFPKLAPDGKRLAYISDERLYVRSIVDGSSERLISNTRTMGAGAWSPNGRFIPAGAWTTRLAFEKCEIVVDTITGDYGISGKLGDGDYGDGLVWVSNQLMHSH
jgi:hypothetical protein